MAKVKEADEAAFKVMGPIGPMCEQGMNLAAIADGLNGMGIEGGGWSATKVKRAIDRVVTTKAKATGVAAGPVDRFEPLAQSTQPRQG